MNPIIEKFNQSKQQFDLERSKEEGNIVMQKIIALVNELGANFSTFNGGELAETQMKLAGYSFYLADYIADLQRISESLKMEIKEQRAKRWDEISELIKAEQGKVKNKDQIENILIIETRDLSHEQILYETAYYKYKLKLNALNDILTVLVQRIAELKRQIEQSKNV